MKKIFLTLITLLFVTGIMAQERVYTPTLKTPTNNATKQMPDVTLNWNAVSGTINLQYEVQLDTTTNFNSPLFVTSTMTLLTGFQTADLLFGTKYYWRVRAIDEGQTSGWSTVWNFTVFSTLEISSPKDGAKSVVPDVALQWVEKVGGVTTTGVDNYEWQLDLTPDFNSPAFQTGQTTSSVFSASMQNLMFGTLYYWRVRASHSADVSDWTSAAGFTTVDTVKQKTPKDNAVDQMINVPLKWEAISGVLSYIYQIARDVDFTDLVVEGETDAVQVDATYLNFGVQYFWRVKARHLLDTTNWPPITPFDFTTINTVFLKSPSQGETGIALKPTLQWTAQTGIEGYQIQVSSDPTFSEVFFSATPDADATSYTLNRSLAGNTVYYWRMRAFTDGGLVADTTAWCDPWSFTTTYGIGIDEGKDMTFSVYPNPASEYASLKIYSRGTTDGIVEIMNLLGQKVLEQPVSLKTGNNVEEFNLNSLAKGVYMIRLTVGKETLNRKLIVEK